MLKRLALSVTRTISFPKNPFILDSDFETRLALHSKIFYLPPDISYEAVIPGVFTTNVQSELDISEWSIDCMQKTRKVAKLKRAKRKYGKRTIIKNH